MATVALLAFAVLAVTDWFAVARGNQPLEYVAKPGALAALVAWAAMAERPSGWLLAALACSLLGDILLMLPAKRFIAGLAAFLLGHLAYLACFVVPAGPRTAAWAVVLVGTVPIAMRLLAAIASPRVRAAVGAYVLVISGMTASAIASGDARAAAGALLFMTSDLVIGWNRFVEPLPSAQPIIMVTYHLGQLGLVAALRGS